MVNVDLINKYSGPVPRYTSYPAVPYWDSDSFSKDRWIKRVQHSFLESNTQSGISLYIHLPFCERLCTYCGCNTRITKNHSVEMPYIASVAKEWQIYKSILGERPIIKEIHLGGGTPTFFSPEHLQVLIEDILDGCEIHSDAEFSFEAHPANTTIEHLTTLRALGFKRLSLGIQDFDPKVQRIINRWQTVEQVLEVTQNARKIGYNSISYDLIYGLPMQTLAGLTKTIKQAIKLNPDRIAYYGYAHVPWVKPGQRMFTEVDLPNADDRQLLYETGRTMLIKAGYEEIGMDHFALKSDSLYKAFKTHNLHRNFMGYTHQFTKLMIGLGVSSISDSWNAFAQNVKKVEDYQQLVALGKLPIFKGHFLTRTDLQMRQHILDVMCLGVTAFTNEELKQEDIQDTLNLLEKLSQDDLIEIKKNEIFVTKGGRRFLRNICLAFDRRYWSTQIAGQVFSSGA